MSSLSARSAPLRWCPLSETTESYTSTYCAHTLLRDHLKAVFRLWLMIHYMSTLLGRALDDYESCTTVSPTVFGRQTLPDGGIDAVLRDDPEW